MSGLSINNSWSKHGKKGASDEQLLNDIAKAMVNALDPCASECVVIHHPTYYTIGCQVPKDIRITLEHMYAGPKVCRTRIRHAWVEWNKKKECFVLCCKLNKSSKRKRGSDSSCSPSPSKRHRISVS